MSTSPKVTLLEEGNSDSSLGYALDSQTEQIVPSLLSSTFPLDNERVELCSKPPLMILPRSCKSKWRLSVGWPHTTLWWPPACPYTPSSNLWLCTWSFPRVCRHTHTHTHSEIQLSQKFLWWTPQNHILNGHLSDLTLLDLSATSDIADCTTLLPDTFSSLLSFPAPAFSWFSPISLSAPSFSVSVHDSSSSAHSFPVGLP